ncbi:site-specific integrase [Candidatus Woesearchaeota archaeon]|nr:site-specific integrase [Candidatus Woesearchaeota archaeon]
MARTSIYTSTYSFESALAKVRENTEITNENKKVMQAYFRYCFGIGLSESRVIKISWMLRKLAIMLGKDFAAARKDDIMELNSKLCLMGEYSPETLNDYRKVLKRFYKWFKGNDEDYPPEVKWLKCTRRLKDKKLVGSLITPEEVKNAIEACDNDRDRAFVALIYESGCRIGEMLTIQIKDFQFTRTYAKLNVRGKTGERRIVILSSVPYICNYLNNHPNRDNPEAYLWNSISPFHKNEPINYIGAVKLIRRVFDKAGIKKKIYPHLFRHSRATELASYLTESQMCNYFGWVMGSNMTAVYVHTSGRETDSALLNYYGIKTDDVRSSKNQPIVCSCGILNEFTNKFCKNCGKALDLKTALDAEEQAKIATNKAFELLMEISKNPELLKEFEEYRKKYKSRTLSEN